MLDNIHSAVEALTSVFKMMNVSVYDDNSVTGDCSGLWEEYGSIKFSSDWKIAVIECFEYTSPHIQSVHIFRWNARRKKYEAIEWA